MSVHFLPADHQAEGAFDGGRILEKKPIGFPQDSGGMRPFSTLFYWAHAWSDEGGLIAEHPHQGFEIVSFILKGSIEHYDNKAREWKRLSAGDAQIIRSGSGITHAERLLPGSAMFQVWFDPDLQRTLKTPASYDDYRIEIFPVHKIDGMRETVIIGEDSPFEMLSPVKAKRLVIPAGEFKTRLDVNEIQAVFLMEGEGTVNAQRMEKGDFAVLIQEGSLNLNMDSESEFFIVEVPAAPPYPLYIERYGW